MFKGLFLADIFFTKGMLTMRATSLTSGVLMLWKAIEHHGLDADAVFIEAGLDPTLLYDANARYPDEKIRKVWDFIISEINDQCVGLTVAEFFHPTSLHALGFTWLACQTLEEAFTRTIRYSRIITDIETFTFDECDDGYRLTIHLPDNKPYFPFEDYDVAFAIVVRLCRLSLGKSFQPQKIVMQRPEPDCVERFNAFFRAPIEFSADSYEMYFSKQDMRRPFSTSNPELLHLTEKVIIDYLARLNQKDTVLRVKTKLIDILPSGTVSSQGIADSLHMSERNLQRKLKEQGTSFKALLEETRRELAKAYLDNSAYSINEITYLLGFSEPANFTRAFKRWNGTSPSHYRQDALG